MSYLGWAFVKNKSHTILKVNSYLTQGQKVQNVYKLVKMLSLKNTPFITSQKLRTILLRIFQY